MSALPVIADCSNCGACCRKMESPPMYLYYLLNPKECRDLEDAQRARSLPGKLKRELYAYAGIMKAGKKHPNNGACIWYDAGTRGCKHYDLRPDICRDFDRSSDGCHEWRREYGIE